MMTFLARHEAGSGVPSIAGHFRFHMTLTGSLAGVGQGRVDVLHRAADAHFQTVSALGNGAGMQTLSVDGLTIFKESAPGAPFQVLERMPFTGTGEGDSLPAPGRLFYVVGPSGVGKDSLLRWVRDHLDQQPGVRFATRAITRATHPSEEHEPISVDDFWQEASQGGFSMIWQANGACYAVRRGVEADLLAGYDVVVNGSREYVPRVAQAFPDAQVVWITAAPGIIEQRLVARQRETGAALLQRVRRSTAFSAPVAHNTIHLDNSGPIELAGTRLLALLQDRTVA